MHIEDLGSHIENQERRYGIVFFNPKLTNEEMKHFKKFYSDANKHSEQFEILGWL